MLTSKLKNTKNMNKVFTVSIILFLSIFLVLPILMLFAKAFKNFDGDFIGLQNFYEYMGTRGFKVSLINSLKVAILSTIIAIVLAFIFAYAIERTNLKFKKFYNWIALLPLFAPTMTHGIALIYLFGNQGIFRKIFGESFSIYGLKGIVISEVIYIFPIIYTIILLGLKKADNRLYEAAEMMDTKSFRQFMTITLPSIKFSLITAVFSAFTMAFTDFGAPKIIGGSFNVLATDVYKQMLGQQNIEMGAVVGILLTLPAIISVIVNIIANKKDFYKLDSKAEKYKIKKRPVLDVILNILIFLISSMIAIIFITIVFSSVIVNWPYDLSLTFKWFDFDFMGLSGYRIFFNTIMVATISAVVGTVIAFTAAYTYTRGKQSKVINQIIYFFSTLPNVVPGLTLGIAYMLFFNYKDNPLKIIYGTFIILIAVNIVHFFATPFLTISSELKSIDSEFENVSEIMGVHPINTIIDVIIPNSWSAIVESFSYYFVNSMMTVSAIVFLYFPYTRVASISMINQADIGNMATASAVAVMIIFANIIFRGIVDRYLKK